MFSLNSIEKDPKPINPLDTATLELRTTVEKTNRDDVKFNRSDIVRKKKNMKLNHQFLPDAWTYCEILVVVVDFFQQIKSTYICSGGDFGRNHIRLLTVTEPMFLFCFIHYNAPV